MTGHLEDWVLGSGRTAEHLLVTHQPASSFWTFQFIEAGLYVALTAVALGAAVWLLRRRTG
jgi:hypothetical protein